MTIDSGHPISGLTYPISDNQKHRLVRHSYLPTGPEMICEWCNQTERRHLQSPYEPLCESPPARRVEAVKKRFEEQAEFERTYAANFRAARPFWTKPL